jgi:hypothetical protein
MNAKKQFLYSAVPARESWIDRERGRSHYKIKTEILPLSSLFASSRAMAKNHQLPITHYPFLI